MSDSVRQPDHTPRHAATSAPDASLSPSIGMRSTVLTGAVVGISLLAFGTGAVALVGQTAAIRPPADVSEVVGPNALSIDDLSVGAPANARLLSANPVLNAKVAPASPAVLTGLASNGIPNISLNAYRVAAARMAAVNPDCGIDWSLLAGIGRIESNHGQYGGATLAANGESIPHIIGETLDGTKWDYITDTDHGALDGDSRFDHAVGPMQFIPSTWAAYGADANDDLKADPFNINDAALGAARYLCAAGGDLRDRAGQTRAILAYNHNNEYLALVLGMADRYKRGIRVDGPVYGNITGALPPVDNTWSPPPASPGPALGAPEQTASAGHHPAKKPAKPASKPTSTATGPGSGSSGAGTTGGGSATTAPSRTANPGTVSTQPSSTPLIPGLPLPAAPSVGLPTPAPSGSTATSMPTADPVSSTVNNVVCAVTGTLLLPCPTPTN